MSNEQTIYSKLRASGMTHSGALGVIGNLMAESGCEACRVQGDFETSRTQSKLYASQVDSGQITMTQFSRDSKGWGLAQWTYYTRKEGLYDYCRSRGKSIGNLSAQIGFLLKELKSDYASLFKFLCTTTVLYEAVKRVCTDFERPAVNNIQQRYQLAQSAESRIKYDPNAIDHDEPEKPESVFWPPRMIDKSMSGKDVEVLQAILKARGYGINSISGNFDDLLDKEARKFQRDHGLSADGVVGPLTWAKLLEVKP